MEQNYSSTKLPTVGASSAIGGASAWSNPSRITADDGSSASWAAFAGGQQSLITGSTFAFQQLPDSAVIDGIAVYVDGSNTGCYGTVSLNISGSTGKDIGALNGSYGGATDLWGKTSISKADIAAIGVSISANDVSGGDGIASIDYVSITVYWHIELPQAEADVPTRIVHKVYSSDGRYLGILPKVSSKLAFPQDINSAGSSLQITCAKFVTNETTAEPLLDNTGAPIQTESNLSIMARVTDNVVALGDSEDDAIFKNGNRVKIWVYNLWYPNGKLIFSGQINKVNFKYGGGDTTVQLLVYSDGLDLDNLIARGYPFNYTNDQVQNATGNGAWTVSVSGPKGGGWNVYGQSFVTGVGVSNVGAISVGLFGSANVTIILYDAPNGNVLGSVTKAVATSGWEVVRFEFASLIPVNASEEYFFGVWVDEGQSIQLSYNTANLYANGAQYNSNYGGGSGGGSWAELTGDLYFITAYGTPTTTTTYSTDDPVSEMMHGILLDYNARGGLITERDFEATGLSLTYVFNSMTIFDSLKKVLEMSPIGYYAYIDLGTAEMDILPVNDTPDFTVVKGKHINELSIGLSIEQVKNYLLLSGGETAGVNLFRDYVGNESVSNYGLRTGTKSDNRITQTATADAIGDSYIEENAQETQETQLTVLNSVIDISLLVPGKTIGFKNFGNFIDDLVLVIARREPNFSDGIATLTLGRLPVTMNAEVQRLQRELLFEQTIANPSAPS